MASGHPVAVHRRRVSTITGRYAFVKPPMAVVSAYRFLRNPYRIQFGQVESTWQDRLCSRQKKSEKFQWNWYNFTGILMYCTNPRDAGKMSYGEMRRRRKKKTSSDKCPWSFTEGDSNDRSIDETINHHENSVESTTLFYSALVHTVTAVYFYNIYNSTTVLHRPVLHAHIHRPISVSPMPIG